VFLVQKFSYPVATQEHEPSKKKVSEFRVPNKDFISAFFSLSYNKGLPGGSDQDSGDGDSGRTFVTNIDSNSLLRYVYVDVALGVVSSR
jgi:hypothetical protein